MNVANLVICALLSIPASPKQPVRALTGTVMDETGAALAGVAIEARPPSGPPAVTVSGPSGEYAFPALAPASYRITFSLVNFARVSRSVDLRRDGAVRLPLVMHLALNADTTVTGKRSFVNLADAENPAGDLVGIAQSASQGAVTGRQLDTRPIMRTGEVLETVPGVITSQHSGEGKANQYYLRGFNLDHGTDFATSVAGIPVNLPTHAHGQGYSDLNFVIPELISGVQYAKGPYFAEQGDFATAGSADIRYSNSLDRPVVHVTGGGEGYRRVLFAVSPSLAAGRLLIALDMNHNDGPWTRPDDFARVTGVVRYSRGTATSGWSLTGMGYRGRWNATDQIPARAVAAGALGQFGSVDQTDGGATSRYSVAVEWQRTRGNAVTKVSVFGLKYGLNLFSNFTYFLHDPEHGDQIEQADRRFVAGGRLTHRRIGRWAGRPVQNTYGLQLRADDITEVGLFHTSARQRLGTVRDDTVLQSSAAVYWQNEIQWGTRVRSIAGIRADGTRFGVEAGSGAGRAIARAALASPKAGLVVGPFAGTELYANAGFGFHSNDARGARASRDPITGETSSGVTPLVRARAAEVGVRSVAVPHLQSTLAIWTLGLESELVFAGDAGTTEASRRSRRSGIEWTNYYSARPWLIFDADLAASRARFTDADPSGPYVPGAVDVVVTLGATIDRLQGTFGSVRLRYFGPRPLVEDASVRSRGTSLVNLQAGHVVTKRLTLVGDVFNALDARGSDIDYYYPSRLPGESAAGVNDIHFHPALPRTARLTLRVGF
jgi:hypothetical protein